MVWFLLFINAYKRLASAYFNCLPFNKHYIYISSLGDSHLFSWTLICVDQLHTHFGNLHRSRMAQTWFTHGLCLHPFWQCIFLNFNHGFITSSDCKDEQAECRLLQFCYCMWPHGVLFMLLNCFCSFFGFVFVFWGVIGSHSVV